MRDTPARFGYNTPMRRFPWVSLWVVLAALGLCSLGYAREPEDAVYVYDLFQEADNCLELFARLGRLPLRSTVILSVEQGPEFILDQPGGEEKLRCVLRFLSGSERRVKALFLQDHGFLRDGTEAARRAARLGDFAARYPGEFAGAQIDVEPHADPTWEVSNADERRLLLEGLRELLRQVRPHLRGLPLAAAVPWWYAETAGELPEGAPGALFQVADELYVMAYNDENLTMPQDLIASWLARIGGIQAFSESGRTHLVLSTREFRSKAHLDDELRGLRHTLVSRPNFAGIAVFHAGSGFQTDSSGER